MTTRHISGLVTILLRLSVGLVGLMAANAWSATKDYQLSPIEVAPDVYVLIGKTEHFTFQNGGNIVNTGFIVGSDGVIVIDSGPSRLYGEQMREAIARVTDKPIQKVIITHFHPDHFLGSQGFEKHKVVALDATIKGIRQQGELFNDAMYRMVGPWMKGTEVVVPQTLDADRHITVAGRPLELLTFSGHTDADLAVFDPRSGVLFASDLVFYQRTATTPHADINRWLDALDQIQSVPFKVLVPGHGPVVTDHRAISQTRNYLSWLRRSLTEMAEQGKSMAEALIPDDSGRSYFSLSVFAEEYQRSVAHLYPAIEQQVIGRGRVNQTDP